VKRLTVDLEDELHLRLKRVSLERGETMSEIIRGLLGAWLPKEEEKLERLRRLADDRAGT
jgi:Arc/MetJ-type ribon-helix-helix transcriptional regulator